MPPPQRLDLRHLRPNLRLLFPVGHHHPLLRHDWNQVLPEDEGQGKQREEVETGFSNGHCQEGAGRESGMWGTIVEIRPHTHMHFKSICTFYC